MAREFRKINRDKLREYTPLEMLEDTKPLTFSFRLLTHKELAEFEDNENVMNIETNELINKTSEIEYDIALMCITSWKNLKVGKKNVKAQIEQGILTNKYILSSIDIYDELRELGKYIRAISLDPALEERLQLIINNK